MVAIQLNGNVETTDLEAHGKPFVLAERSLAGGAEEACTEKLRVQMDVAWAPKDEERRNRIVMRFGKGAHA